MPKSATKWLKNVNVLGDVWNPLTGEVKAGAVVEVPADVADDLAQQISNWLIVDAPSED